MDMEESKKQFKLVYDSDNHTYTIWVQDDQGFWLRKESFVTERKEDGSWESRFSDYEMISERILWVINIWTYMDYEFIGIEHGHKEEEI